MKCKFCNHEMISETIFFAGRDRTVVKCNNHKPSKVIYKFNSRFGDVWKVFYDEYVLNYFDGRTVFQKINKKAEKVSDYYQNIKSFDHELSIMPEQFPKKLQTMLTFL